MRTHATREFLGQFFRVRFAAVPPLGVLLWAFWQRDPARWKAAALAVTILASLVLYALQYWRFQRRGPRPLLIELDTLGTLLLFLTVLLLTGGIESPLLLGTLLAALFLGLHPASLRLYAVLLSLLVASVLFFAAGTYGHFLPAPPAFLLPSPVRRPLYVATLAGMSLIGIAAFSSLGARLRLAFEHMVREAARARAESAAALLGLNREIVAASATLAHEIKNPLASLQGLAQLLCRGAPAGSKERERLDVMLREIARVRTAVDEFRDLTRPLSGLVPRPTRLDALVREVALLQEGQAQERGVALLPRAQAPVEAVCDPHKLKQALLNLLQNSLEASRAGDRIEVAVEGPEEDRVRLVVRDSGPGLSEEARRHLFVAGFTTKPAGSGIGLLVARQVAQQHGGSLEIGGGAGAGCVATLTLPLQQAGGGP